MTRTTAQGRSMAHAPAWWSRRFDTLPMAAGLALGLVGVLGPRALPALLVLALLSLIPFTAPKQDAGGASRYNHLTWAGIGVWCAVAGWATISLLWTPDVGNGVGKVATAFVIIGAVGLLAVRAARLEPVAAGLLLMGACVGALVGLGFVTFEMFSGQAIKIWFYNAVPELRGSLKHVAVSDGVVVDVGLQERNRSIATLNLVFWPLAGYCWLRAQRTHDGPSAARILSGPGAAIIGCWVVLCAATFASVHETSKLAVLAGAAGLGLGLVGAAWAGRLMIGAWCAVFVLIIPFALALYANDVHRAPGLEASAQARVVLWAVTAQKWQERPVTGIGVAGTRALDDRDKATAPWPEGYPYALRTGRHAHNVYLQTFYELGVIGALLLAIGGSVLVRGMGGLAPALQPFGLAAFATSAATIGLSWGMWQAWFQCAFAAVIVLLILGNVASSRRLVQAGPQKASDPSPDP